MLKAKGHLKAGQQGKFHHYFKLCSSHTNVSCFVSLQDFLRIPINYLFENNKL